MTSAEFTGWLAYLQVDDEVQVQRLAYAIARAFNGDKTGKKQQAAKEDEEVIDTTDPKFAEQFKGFTYGGKPQPPHMPSRQTSTEILFG